MLSAICAPRKKGSVSVIAVFAVIGIMLGVATLIIVLSVLNGFRKELFDKILGLNGHVIVRPLARSFTDYNPAGERLKAVGGVKSVLAVIEGQVMISSKADSSGILVRGLRDQDLNALQTISGNLRSGSLEGFNESGGIAIGSRLASMLNVAVGNEVSVLAPTASHGTSGPRGASPRVKRYRIQAIFEMGMSEYDSTVAFMPFQEAQSFFNLPDSVHVLEVMLDDPDKVRSMRGALQDAAGPDMVLSDWQQRNASFDNTLQDSAEYDVRHRHADRAGGDAEYNFRAHHACEEQRARYRRLAHHGGHTRGGHARVLNQRDEYRLARHTSGLGAWCHRKYLPG